MKIPKTLARYLQNAFANQAMSARFKDLFDKDKLACLSYIEGNRDGFEFDLGTNLKCDQGMVLYLPKTSVEYDKAQLAHMVIQNTISLESLINLASFNASDLQTCLGETNFNKIATISQTGTSLQFRASPEFKKMTTGKLNQSGINTRV